MLVIYFTNRDSMFTFVFAFVPVYFVGLVLRYFTGKITIEDNILSTRISMEKYEIDLNRVKSYEVKKKNIILQIVLGVPKEVTQVEYNKYDTIVLNSADPVLLEALSSRK